MSNRCVLGAELGLAPAVHLGLRASAHRCLCHISTQMLMAPPQVMLGSRVGVLWCDSDSTWPWPCCFSQPAACGLQLLVLSTSIYILHVSSYVTMLVGWIAQCGLNMYAVVWLWQEAGDCTCLVTGCRWVYNVCTQQRSIHGTRCVALGALCIPAGALSSLFKASFWLAVELLLPCLAHLDARWRLGASRSTMCWASHQGRYVESVLEGVCWAGLCFICWCLLTSYYLLLCGTTTSCVGGVRCC